MNEELEYRMRFAEEERQEAERNAYYQGFEDGIDKFAHELKETFNSEIPSNYASTQPFFTLENVRTLVDMVLKERK